MTVETICDGVISIKFDIGTYRNGSSSMLNILVSSSIFDDKSTLNTFTSDIVKNPLSGISVIISGDSVVLSNDSSRLSKAIFGLTTLLSGENKSLFITTERDSKSLNKGFLVINIFGFCILSELSFVFISILGDSSDLSNDNGALKTSILGFCILSELSFVFISMFGDCSSLSKDNGFVNISTFGFRTVSDISFTFISGD